jgi:hypothetical protein
VSASLAPFIAFGDNSNTPLEAARVFQPVGSTDTAPGGPALRKVAREEFTTFYYYTILSVAAIGMSPRS